MERIFCKYLEPDMRSMYNTVWKEGVPNELPNRKKLKVGKEGLFHFFSHPILAGMFKDVSGCKSRNRLHRVVPEGVILHKWDYSGSTKLTVFEELDHIEVNEDQRQAFIILCLMEVHNEPRCVEWANKWLNGEDRSSHAASVLYRRVCRDENATTREQLGALVAYDMSTGYIDCSTWYKVFDFATTEHPDLDLVTIAKLAMEIK